MIKEVVTQWIKKMPFAALIGGVIAMLLITSQGMQFSFLPMVVGVSIGSLLILLVDVLEAAIKQKLNKR